MRAPRAWPAVIVVLAAACSSGAASHAAGPTAPATAAPLPAMTLATTAAPTTTTTAAPATTTVALAPVSSPLAAADALLGAWRAGDRQAAARVATPDAVAALFAGPPRAYSDRGCQDPLNGASACAFGAGSGLIQLQTINVPAGWIVESVTVNS